MINALTVGILSGLASALLFAVVVTGSPFGIVLSYVAPLPILIVGLGWTGASWQRGSAKRDSGSWRSSEARCFRRVGTTTTCS